MSVNDVVSETGGHVFRSETGKPLTNIAMVFKRALKRAGIKNFRFHDLRHTFAAHLASNGVEILVLKDLLGHKTLLMTQRYAHLFPDRGRKAVDRLPGLLGAPTSPATPSVTSLTPDQN